MRESNCCVIFLLFFFCGRFRFNVACSEHAVYKAIFDGYNNQIRPVKNQSTITHVYVDTTIYSILSINEQDESIDLITVTSFEWTDEFLSWNESDFGSCSVMLTPASNIWLPDYVYYNTVENFEILPNGILYAMIFSNGTVLLTEPLHRTLRCSMDIVEFPFDMQTCPINAGLWTYTSDQVILRSMPLDNDSHVVLGSSEYETISFSGEDFGSVQYGPTSYSEIHYSLVLKRRPAYYIFVIFIPSFILTTLCIIGIFTPNSSEGERNEKMTLGLTTLLSMAVILNITADEMPKSSKGLPLLGYYILYEIAICSLSTVLSTAIICMHERARTESLDPPTIVRWIATISFPCECIRRVINSSKQAKVSNNFAESSTFKVNLKQNGENHVKGNDSSMNNSLSSSVEVSEVLLHLQQIMIKIDNHLINLKKDEENIRVWISALHKVDCFLLVTFLVVNCALTIYIVF